MSSFLQEYKRQPKLFIDLPSKGKWYNDSIVKDGNVEKLPVFGMNAMDEIVFQTPDALFTGEATAQVIQSCVPDILDPWELVGYDIDFLLVAMRIATYGTGMPVSTKCPQCSVTTESEVDLSKTLDNFSTYTTEFSFEIKNFTFYIRPLTYRVTTQFSMAFYNLERQLYQLSQIEITDENQKELNQKKQQLHKAMNEINIEIASNHIEKVESNGLEETNIDAIRSFIVDNDADFYQALRQNITELTLKWNLPNISVACGGEECENVYQSTLNVDYSSFFGTNSLRSRNLILYP